MLDVLHRANPRLIGLDLQFVSASPHPAQDRTLLSAFARDGPVLVSVSDTGAEVPTIVGVKTPRVWSRPAVPSIRTATVSSGNDVRPGASPDVRDTGAPRQCRACRFRQRRYPITTRGSTLRAAGLLSDLFDGEGARRWGPSSAFAGKVVLVGVTTPITKDVFVTSASSKPMSGVEVQANSIEMALRGFPLEFEPNPERGGDHRTRGRARVAESSGELSARCAVVLHAYRPVPWHGRARLRSRIILPVPDPIVGLVIATCGVIAVESLIERRKICHWKLLQDFLRPGKRLLRVLPAGPEQLVARSLRSALAARFGDASVFMDVTAISPGQEWPRASSISNRVAPMIPRSGRLRCDERKQLRPAHAQRGCCGHVGQPRLLPPAERRRPDSIEEELDQEAARRTAWGRGSPAWHPPHSAVPRGTTITLCYKGSAGSWTGLWTGNPAHAVR